MKTVVFANFALWANSQARKAGKPEPFAVKESVSENGRVTTLSVALGIPAKSFTQDQAKALIAAYKAKGCDLSNVKVSSAANAQTNQTIAGMLLALGQGKPLTSMAIRDASGLSCCAPSTGNRLLNDLLINLMSKGYVVEGARGNKSEPVAEVEIDFDSVL